MSLPGALSLAPRHFTRLAPPPSTPGLVPRLGLVLPGFVLLLLVPSSESCPSWTLSIPILVPPKTSGTCPSGTCPSWELSPGLVPAVPLEPRPRDLSRLSLSGLVPGTCPGLSFSGLIVPGTCPHGTYPRDLSKAVPFGPCPYQDLSP